MYNITNNIIEFHHSSKSLDLFETRIIYTNLQMSNKNLTRNLQNSSTVRNASIQWQICSWQANYSFKGSMKLIDNGNCIACCFQLMFIELWRNLSQINHNPDCYCVRKTGSRHIRLFWRKEHGNENTFKPWIK